jgi:hypothetical protein
MSATQNFPDVQGGARYAELAFPSHSAQAGRMVRAIRDSTLT